MVKVRLPRQLMNYTDLCDDFECHATTIKLALDELIESYPFLRSQIYNVDRTLRHFVNVFVNEQMVENLEANISPHSRIQIIVAVAGG